MSLLARAVAVLVVLGSSLALADTQRLALVIGNAEYADLGTPLNVAIKSARAVAEQLQTAGFHVEARENLTRESLQQSLQKFYDKIEPGAIIVFFYSGYAIQTGRQNYIIPIDAMIWTESDVRRDGASIESILAAIRDKGAGTRVLVLDASRRNPFERRFRSYSAGLSAIETPTNTIIISAASPGKVIADADSDNSLFVDELLRQTNTLRVPVVDIFDRTREGSHASPMVSRCRGCRSIFATGYISVNRSRCRSGRGRSRSCRRDDRLPAQPIPPVLRLLRLAAACKFRRLCSCLVAGPRPDRIF